MTKAKTVEIKIDKTNLFREYNPEIFSGAKLMEWESFYKLKKIVIK